jgi:hypothetical protein
MKLEVFGNHDECAAVEAVINLRNDKLTELDVSKCAFGVSGAIYLGDALRINNVGLKL